MDKAVTTNDKTKEMQWERQIEQTRQPTESNGPKSLVYNSI